VGIVIFKNFDRNLRASAARLDTSLSLSHSFSLSLSLFLSLSPLRKAGDMVKPVQIQRDAGWTDGPLVGSPNSFHARRTR